MFEEYQKETNIKDKTDEDKKVELIMSLIKAKKELEELGRKRRDLHISFE